MSRVDKVQETMQRILWDNILEDFLSNLMLAYPVLGWPVFREIILLLVEKFIVKQLFTVLARWGVFTSIDWQNEVIYEAYKSEAIRLVGAQEKDDWPEHERKAFKDAARKLARFNISRV